MADQQNPADFFGVDFTSDPHNLYSALRQDGRAHPIMLAGGVPAWSLTSYQDCRAAFLDNETYSKDMEENWTEFRNGHIPLTGDVMIGMGDSMLVSDPPRHSRLRALVSRAFTARRIEAMAPVILETAQSLLNEVEHWAQENPGQPVDMVAHYAALLPMSIISRMLDIPPVDGERLRHCIEAVMSSDEESRDQAFAAFGEVHAYLAAHVEAKREAPADDLTSALIQANENSDKLDHDELVSMLALLLSAGHETTVNLISSSILLLLNNPGELSVVTRDPGLWPQAIEEVLRMEPPIQNAIWRFTKRPVRYGDVTIPAGEAVALTVASAGREQQACPHADQFQVERQSRKHLAFGHGLHHCLGAPLARLEAGIALPLVFQRLDGIRLAGEPRYRASTVSRALAELPVSWTGVSPTTTQP